MLAFIQNTNGRAIVLQIAYVAFVAALVLTLILNARENLNAQGITSGFDFLTRSTGWRINFSLIEYSSSSPYWKALLAGFLNSLLVGAISLALATLIGVLVGVMRTSGIGVFELIGASYVEIFRNIPILLQLFFWYSLLLSLPSPVDVLPSYDGLIITGRGIFIASLNVHASHVLAAAIIFTGAILSVAILRRFRNAPVFLDKAGNRWKIYAVASIIAVAVIYAGRMDGYGLLDIPEKTARSFRGGIRIPPELLACVIAISLYGAAYIAEIVRAGLNSVQIGQSEASFALGLSPWQTFSRIRFPLAVRNSMLALTNQYVWLMKSTTIGLAVGFSDFFMVVSTSINQSGQTIELLGIFMVGFLAVNFTLAFVMLRINDALRIRGVQQKSGTDS